MKNKKGFTLPELLVVIVIIAVIAAIAIPSVIVVNSNINKRLYNNKVNLIVSAAELYATDNPDIFNGKSQVVVYVAELINENYLEIESSDSSVNYCLSINVDGRGEITTPGCILNPTDKTSMNSEYVLLTKQSIGVTAEFGAEGISSTEDTLVKEICRRFEDGTFTGKYNEGTGTCKCQINSLNDEIALVDESNNKVAACLIYGDENQNWLRYDDNDGKQVMWRVMGLYDIYSESTNLGSAGKLAAKMITNESVDIVE